MNECIYCDIDPLSSPISDEHVIPRVLGGWITAPIACKRHNEILGEEIEGILKRNGYVAMAIARLGLQTPDAAFRNANIQAGFSKDHIMGASLDCSGSPHLLPRTIDGGSFLVPEDQSVRVLQKQVRRYETTHKTTVNFDWSTFGSLPFDRVHRIPGTDICFVKRQGQVGQVQLLGLDQPIPFRLPAKIALSHVAAIEPKLAHGNSFSELKTWLLRSGPNKFVLLNSPLQSEDPAQLSYSPVHHLTYRIDGNTVSAVVTLFGVIRFSVFLGFSSQIVDFPHLEVFEGYQVYDIQRRSLYRTRAPREYAEQDRLFLDVVATLHQSVGEGGEL
jgi:HNH endonuclease